MRKDGDYVQGYLTNKEEWLYPDMPLVEIDNQIAIHTARNGSEAVKLLFKTYSENVRIRVEENSDFMVERSEMIDVYVGYNEVENEIQDGQFVITDKEYEKPDFCTQKAPFRVYEAIKPIEDTIHVKNNVAPIYISIKPKEKAPIGESHIKIIIEDGTLPHGREILHIDVNVYNVIIPKETLKITNWFSLHNMSTYHNNLPLDSKDYYDMVRTYAKTMRRLRQTHFFINYDPRRVVKDKGIFVFNYLIPIIKIFFEEDFEIMEFGNFLNKTPTLFTKDLKCSFDNNLCISSDEGYFMMEDFINALKGFLIENDWNDKTIFHICDEPDVHMESNEVLEIRKQDYFKVANMLKKAIPGCKIIEAVKSTEFKSAIDIWVPLTANYEEFREVYDKMQVLGDEVWCYVCCVPTGYHLNRFLDIDLIKSRLIFWGISKYNLKGYLHWGFNQQPSYNFDLFENSNTPNLEFNGIFPSGDAFIVYPLENQLLLGMRFEAQRRGAEDYELLKVLKDKNRKAYDDIMKSILTSFNDYNGDEKHFEDIRIRLYKLLEEK